MSILLQKLKTTHEKGNILLLTPDNLQQREYLERYYSLALENPCHQRLDSSRSILTLKIEKLLLTAVRIYRTIFLDLLISF